jgi:hypothetical protein
MLLSLAGYPDLAVENLVAPATGVCGADVHIEYDVYNLGDTATGDGWDDTIMAGRKIFPMVGVIGIPVIEQHTDSLAAGDHVHVAKDVTLPAGPAGTLYVQVTANSTFGQHLIDEGNQDDNNAARATIRATATPTVDLKPTSLTPGAAPIAGQSLLLNWQVDNVSGNAAHGSWTDSVYFSLDAKFDSKDLLVGSQAWSNEVLAGQSYTSGALLKVPQAAVGNGYLILVTNTDHGAPEVTAATKNNSLAVPVTIQGFNPASMHGGMFLACSPDNLVKLDTYASAAGATMDVWFSTFTPLPIQPTHNAAPPALPLALANAQPLPTGLGSTTLVVDTAGLAYGTYTLNFRMKDGGGNVISTETMAVTLVTSSVSKNDVLGEAIGGDSYEVYNLSLGRADDLLLFRAGGNYSSDDADFRIRVGPGKGRASDTFGIPHADRTTYSLVDIFKGHLYTDVVFSRGVIVHSIPALIDTFGGEVVGQSFSDQLAHTGIGDWKYDVFAGVQLSALGPDAAKWINVGWTMYCGNDEINVDFFGGSLVAVPAVPQVTGLKAKYDGNPDKAVVGRYIGGVTLVETLGATVKAPTGDPVVAVIFDIAGERFVDTNSKDGWSFPYDVGTLSGNTALAVTAVTASGQTSAPYAGQVQVIPMPSWLPVLDRTTATFLKTSKTYKLTAADTIVGQGGVTPVGWSLIAGKSIGADFGVALELTVTTVPTATPKFTYWGYATADVLGNRLLSKKLTKTSKTASGGTFQSTLLFGGDLEITSFSGTLTASVPSLKGTASFAKYFFASYVWTTAKMTFTGSFTAQSTFHYDAVKGIVADGVAGLAFSGTAAISGPITSSKPADWPAGQAWALTGKLRGQVVVDFDGSVAPPAAPVYTLPVTAHVAANLTESDAVLAYVNAHLGWATRTPDLVPQQTVDLIT